MVGLLVNIYFLVTNGLSMNKGAVLHSLTNFQLAFYVDEQIEIEQGSFTSLSNCDGQLSKTHRSSYSIWEFVHALNGVVEADDMNKLKQAWYFLYSLTNQTTSAILKIFGYIASI